MKNIENSLYAILFLITVSFTGCNTMYTVTQDSLINSPCNTSAKGVNVRIKNDGTIPFSKFILKVNNTDFSFEGLNAGEISCYKNIPQVWTNNSFEIWYYRNEKYGTRRSVYAIDHTGERKIDNGYVTISILTNGSIRKAKEFSIKTVYITENEVQ